MRTYGFDTDLWSVLPLITTLTLWMFPPSICPARKGNGCPAQCFSLLTARPARSCIILWVAFLVGLLFSYLRSPTPRQKSRLHLAVFRKLFEKTRNACVPC